MLGTGGVHGWETEWMGKGDAGINANLAAIVLLRLPHSAHRKE